MALFKHNELNRARRICKQQLHEGAKLTRRSRKSNLSKDVRSKIDTKAEQIKGALETAKDPKKLLRHADEFEALLEKHLARFRKPAWRESFESIAVAILVALAVRSFAVEAFKIPSGSMIPTLAIGDQIFVNKSIFGVRIPFTPIRLIDFGLPQRGEVVVFICPVPPNQDYIKRVIGLPGDEIAVRNDTIYLNGAAIPRKSLGEATYMDKDPDGRWSAFEAERFEESLGEHRFTVLKDPRAFFTARDYGPVVVPPGHLFVMGDNRNHSSDSRAWGFVPQQNVLGRSLFVWWSWGHEGLATERLGTWIK